MSLSIILPCYNEAQNIAATLQDVFTWLQTKDFLYEVIAVNDGSKDATLNVLESQKALYPHLVIVSYEKNRGYGNALIAGLDKATQEIVAFMDSDGQFKAADFDNLLPHMGAYKIVTGRRSRRADPFFRKVNALLYGTLVKVALRVYVRDINCAMKMWYRDLWPTLRPRIASGALFNAEVFLRAKGAGIPWHQVPVEHYPRIAGEQTGAKISVILRMFAELFSLRKKYTEEQRQKA
jgi:glycosyltransferase involved in cell wall biosynthesis